MWSHLPAYLLDDVNCALCYAGATDHRATLPFCARCTDAFDAGKLHVGPPYPWVEN